MAPGQELKDLFRLAQLQRIDTIVENAIELDEEYGYLAHLTISGALYDIREILNEG